MAVSKKVIRALRRKVEGIADELGELIEAKREVSDNEESRDYPREARLDLLSAQIDCLQEALEALEQSIETLSTYDELGG